MIINYNRKQKPKQQAGNYKHTIDSFHDAMGDIPRADWRFTTNNTKSDNKDKRVVAVVGYDDKNIYILGVSLYKIFYSGYEWFFTNCLKN